MILDKIENARQYYSLHPRFAEAFEYIRKVAANLPEPGRHEIAGDELYAMIVDRPGKTKSGATLEWHCRYIDIQFTAEGSEVIGWRSTSTCSQTTVPYEEASDAGRFGDASATWFDVAPGSFAIFFPEDAHAPLAGEGTIRKVVVKVAV